MSAPVIGWGQVDCHNMFDLIESKMYDNLNAKLYKMYGRGYVVLSSTRVPTDMGKSIEDMVVRWHADQTDSDGEPLYKAKVSATYTYDTLCPVEHDDKRDVWTMMAVHEDSFTDIIHVAGPAYGCRNKLNAKHLTLVPTGEDYSMDYGEDYAKPGAVLMPDGGNVKHHNDTSQEVDFIDLHVGNVVIHIDFEAAYMLHGKKAVRISAMDQRERGYRGKLLPIVATDANNTKKFDWEVLQFDYEEHDFD